MNENWHERLKNSRKAKKITLDEISEYIGLSKQSIIQYEKGEIFPNLDRFAKMIEYYDVSSDYIIFGNNDNRSFAKKEGEEVLTLAMLLYQNKILFDEERKAIIIIDEKINNKFKYASWFISSNDLGKIENLERLIGMIKKI